MKGILPVVAVMVIIAIPPALLFASILGIAPIPAYIVAAIMGIICGVLSVLGEMEGK